MGKDFETEVLTRLALIESKIDDYKAVKQKTDYSLNLATENKKEIVEINEKIKWLTRTITGALITGAIGLVFLLIQKGVK